jgi:hypothetical protein
VDTARVGTGAATVISTHLTHLHHTGWRHPHPQRHPRR